MRCLSLPRLQTTVSLVRTRCCTRYMTLSKLYHTWGFSFPFWMWLCACWHLVGSTEQGCQVTRISPRTGHPSLCSVTTLLVLWLLNLYGPCVPPISFTESCKILFILPVFGQPSFMQQTHTKHWTRLANFFWKRPDGSCFRVGESHSICYELFSSAVIVKKRP